MVLLNKPNAARKRIENLEKKYTNAKNVGFSDYTYIIITITSYVRYIIS